MDINWIFVHLSHGPQSNHVLDMVNTCRQAGGVMPNRDAWFVVTF